MAVTHVDDFRYINTWGYGYGTHINIEYEVMNILSYYPPSVVQLTDNPDRTTDHSTSLAAAPNRITGAAFIRTIYDKDNSAKQNKNVLFCPDRCSRAAPGPTRTPSPIIPTLAFPTESNVPFFSGVSIHATSNNRFILAWAKQENGQQDIYETIYDATTGNRLLPHQHNHRYGYHQLHQPKIGRAENQRANIFDLHRQRAKTSSSPSLWGVKLDSRGNRWRHFQIAAINGIAKVDPGLQITAIKNASKADDFQIAVINGSRFDTVQLSGGNILVAWVNDNQPKNPPTAFGTPTAASLKARRSLDSPDGLSASQIAVTYDEYGHGILTWGNQNYSRMYYALVDGSGVLLTPAMIQREAQTGQQSISILVPAHMRRPF